jgi:hypothetical protein
VKGVRLASIAAISLALACHPAQAQHDERPWAETQAIFDRGCGDDRGIDRCDEAVQQRMRDLYRLESPTKMLEQGITARRAMFVDGYGNDMAAITFARRPGESPTVEVRAPIAEGQPPPRPLVANISNETWATVLARSKDFDQQLARELPRASPDGGEEPTLNICLHAWFVVAEAVDAPRVSPNVLAGTGSEDSARDAALPVEAPMQPGTVRSDAESACAGGLAVDYAFELASMALIALPECSTLNFDDFRNQVVLLGQCYGLGGDRLTAGEAYRTVSKLERALRREDKEDLSWLFVGVGDTRADLFMAALGGGSPYLLAPTGVDADHAEVPGQVIYLDKDRGEIAEVADLSLQLLRQVGEFVIDTFQVANRRPFTPSGDGHDATGH